MRAGSSELRAGSLDRALFWQLSIVNCLLAIDGGSLSLLYFKDKAKVLQEYSC